MAKNPRNYPASMPSTESGRPMQRGEKLVSFKIDGKAFNYLQPGWWCDLADPEDLDGQLVDEDNQVADMARRTAKVLARGEKVFVPVVIRSIRQSCGLTQREAGLLFGSGEKSFEKYESGEILPSGPTQRLLAIAMEHPEWFTLPENRARMGVLDRAETFVLGALRAGHVDRLYAPLFAGVGTAK